MRALTANPTSTEQRNAARDLLSSPSLDGATTDQVRRATAILVRDGEWHIERGEYVGPDGADITRGRDELIARGFTY